MINKLKYLIIIIFNFISDYITFKQKYFLFGNAYGDFSDNSRALFLYFFKQNHYQDKIFFVLKNKKNYLELRTTYPVVYYYSLKMILIVFQSKYYFFTQGVSDIFFFKTKTTVAVNLWHGTPIKKIGYDSVIETKWIEEFKNKGIPLPYQSWDYFITGNTNINFLFQSAMKISKDKLLSCGLPRNDNLYDIKNNNNLLLKEIALKITSFLHIQSNMEVILYAPTFREINKINFINTVELFLYEFQNNRETSTKILLLRLHPSDTALINKELFSDKIIDASPYPNMQELLIYSDVLITDYSSSIFDYSILERPIIMYLFDYKDYLLSRGVYYNIEEEFLGYGISYTIDDLMKKIKFSYKYTNENFHKKFNMQNASRNILKALGL